MSLTRYINESLIDIDLNIPRDPELEENCQEKRIVAHYRESVISRIADLLCESGRVGNRNKLFNDLLNREKRACTAIGRSVAIPHVRTLQARSTVVGFLRAREALPFGALDGQNVQIFVPIVGPPYDDKVYLRIYRQLGELLQQENILDRFLALREPGEVIRLLGGMD